MSNAIAIVGVACCYPDARSPAELWENVLAQRKAFRRIPPERLRLDDYWSEDRSAPDCTYSSEAALIEGYEFDRARFRIAGNTFRAADPAHWLALDVAAQTLTDAGFNNGDGLPRESTGVFLGNTLTGEFSRANNLRLRWPYVRRVVNAALAGEEWSREQRENFCEALEADYKKPFPPVGEESLAGGLSNTIAGRICNHFDLQGGGYTVDGACASSLLAVANACSALTAGDLDSALAGGVDLSLDPFELVGFAKTGALASGSMRIYDRRSNGFWPGEGCGFVLMMRHEDALAQRLHIHALIKGWGISSDGNGGITRPEIKGQLLALKRAYRRAGFGIETVAYFEGHGTGTAVGDAVELRALSRARQEAVSQGPAAAIGSVKANIGHTKAAAGVAGLIKAVCALDAGIIPPTTGCEDPQDELRSAARLLRTLKKAEPWPPGRQRRAGVSSMGFGGINAHLVLEAAPREPPAMRTTQQSLISSAQDAEIFLLAAESRDELLRQVEHLITFASRISYAELSDLAAQLQCQLKHGNVRGAIVASNPAALGEALKNLALAITSKRETVDINTGVFFSVSTRKPRIGFLFPGQGSPSHIDGGSLRRRFQLVEDIYAQARLAEVENEVATEIAQPAIVAASLAALRVLSELGITGEIAVGHSLGELTALCWAGAIDEASLLRIARARGRAIMQSGDVAGGMASIGAGAEEVRSLLNGNGVCIAGYNSPLQTVVSGEVNALSQVMDRARSRNISAVSLPVSHAFHNPRLSPAGATLAAHLASEEFRPLRRQVISTITGEPLLHNANLREILERQVTSPVLFMAAIRAADTAPIDYWIEVGPGKVLRGIMSNLTTTPVVSIDAGSDSVVGLLCAVGAGFVLGQPMHYQVLLEERFTRSFNLDWHPRFFTNPCELAPLEATTEYAPRNRLKPERPAAQLEFSEAPRADASALELLTQLLADGSELSAADISPHSRFLSDLHLNSIKVSQLVGEVAHRLHLPRPVSATDFSDATIAETAQALDEQLRLGGAAPGYEMDLFPAGIDAWVKPFCVELVERPLAKPAGERPSVDLPADLSDPPGAWQVVGPPEHAFENTLRERLAHQPGRGVVVCVPPDPGEGIIDQLLDAARLALNQKPPCTFVLVQDGRGAAAFARTFHLEAPRITTCVINVPQAHPQAADWVTAEIQAADGYVEAHYDQEGRRFESLVRPLADTSGSEELFLSPADVLLVSGGGKGITAECAFALAQEFGVRLALLGRSSPGDDADLSSNLKRFETAGIAFRYFQADVTNTDEVRATVASAQAELGPVTGIMHGAARNAPQLIVNLDQESFRETLAVKVQGARNLLAAINPQKLKLLITFGSIIARTGLPGEADYGLANEWLTELTEDWKAKHPSCRCVAVEWSIWSGKGMGGRLGDTDRFMQQGITPISPDHGVRMLCALLRRPDTPVPVVVMSRFSDLPTFKIDRPELPFLRFLDEPKVYYPGIEVVAAADLSTVNDPYLNDHVFQGNRLLPAVMGLEAMAQAAAALTGSTQPPVFENVRFAQPVVVPESSSLKIHLAALARGSGVVDVCLRSEETDFQVDHFQATCRFEDKEFEVEPHSFPSRPIPSEHVPLDPERDLYGGILFQSGRFRRISNYRLLRATECIAEISPNQTGAWFSQYLPGTLLLGDPGARDATLHAIQACIPHKTLLPIAVERLSIALTVTAGPHFVHARERSCEGDIFVYDIIVRDAEGHLRESWEGLRLKAVCASPNGSWPESLLAPYIQRHVEELIPGRAISVALVRSSETDRHARSDRAIRMALNEEAEILRRPDGKPEVNGGQTASASHAGELTLAVTGTGPLSCDIERVVQRSDSAWLDLLGSSRFELARFNSRTTNEDKDVSATRIWTAGECLKKIGATSAAPLTLLSPHVDGWVLLSSGQLVIASWLTQERESAGQSVLSVLVNRL